MTLTGFYANKELERLIALRPRLTACQVHSYLCQGTKSKLAVWHEGSFMPQYQSVLANTNQCESCITHNDIWKEFACVNATFGQLEHDASK